MELSLAVERSGLVSCSAETERSFWIILGAGSRTLYLLVLAWMGDVSMESSYLSAAKHFAGAARAANSWVDFHVPPCYP